MKPRSRKRAIRPMVGKKKPRVSGGGGGDSFFESDTKQRGRRISKDDDLESMESDDDLADLDAGQEEEEEGEGVPEETVDEKRVRVAKEHLERIRAIAKRVEEEEEEDEEEGRDEREGKRDSLVAEILQKEQLEESGRVRRYIASR